MMMLVPSGKAYVVFYVNCTEQRFTSDADVIIRGEDNGDSLGWSLAGDGDYNGDSIGDIVIGAPGELNSSISPGKIHLYSGSSLNNLPTNSVISASQADLSMQGQHNADRAGYSLAFINDIDGDTWDDIVVSAIENDVGGDNAGIIYIVGSTELNLNPSPFLHDTTRKLIGEEPNNYAGYSIAIQQDTDGDDTSEICIGAYGNSANGPSTGRVYQLTSTRLSNRSMSLSESSLFFSGLTNYEWFGRNVSAIGDINDDGTEDILIGSPNHSSNGNYSGKIYFANFPLGQSIDTVQFTASISPDENSNVLRCQPNHCVPEPLEGFADWTNDSDGTVIGTDLVLILTDDNSHYLDPISCSLNLFDLDGYDYTDSVQFTTTALVAQHSFIGTSPQDKTGISITGGGDFNGDGIHDVVMGAPFSDTPSGQTGAAFIWLSSNPPPIRK